MNGTLQVMAEDSGSASKKKIGQAEVFVKILDINVRHFQKTIGTIFIIVISVNDFL